MAQILTIENLSFTYPNRESDALNNVNLSVEEGEFILLTGPSGCGKTTLLRQMKKSLIPYGKKSGQVNYRGREITELDDRTAASAIGYVFQDPENQIVTNKVWHELAFGLESLGYKRQDMERRIGEVANYFGISQWIDRETSDLSGGEKQILNLAAIIAMEPDVILLDEPTSQLDPIAAGHFIDALSRIHEELGLTIILSEHRIEEVYGMADCVVRMDHGAIIGAAGPREMAWECTIDCLDYPAATRIWAGLDRDRFYEKPPITVGEGRRYLQHMKPHQMQGRCADGATVLRELGREVMDGSDLHFRYDKTSPEILKGCHVGVGLGSIRSIVGCNGSGKSTLLRVLAGVLVPDGGKYICFGERVRSIRDIHRGRDGLVLLPQDPKALFHGITVEEELREMLETPKNEEEEHVVKRQVEEMLERLGLSQLTTAHPYDLSGGEAQRLALGKLLILEPQVLLLDEPTKGLDPENRRMLGRLLRSLVDQGKGVLMVTHDLDFAANYSDQVSMLFDGRLSEPESPRDFFLENRFYTTPAARISRGSDFQGVTVDEVVGGVS